MTAQEQQMIQSLIDRINNTPLDEKDPDAESFLQQGLGRNPDALYILAQTVLVQQYALDQAQKQLADARAQADQQRQQPPAPKHATSFLGNLLGLHEDQPAPPPPPQQGYPQGGYQPVQEYGPGSFGPPRTQGYSMPSQGYGPPPPAYGQPQQGGFLRSALQTATGVAAGALAFQGIESLMHGFGGSGGGSGFSSGGRSEEIVNNYYGDSAGKEHEHPLSSDIEDRRGESSSFADAVTNDDHHDSKDGLLDTSNSDDQAADDLANFDDASSFDDGSSDSGSDSGSDDSNY